MAREGAKVAALIAAGAGGLFLWHRATAPRLVIGPKPKVEAGDPGTGFGFPEDVTLHAQERPTTLIDLATGARTLPEDGTAAAMTLGLAPLYTSLEITRRAQSGLASLVTGDLEMRQDFGPNDPRGLRNNNPGNIKLAAVPWRGQVTGDDPVFVTFAAPKWGLRAMWYLLDKYQSDYGLKSVREMISRWSATDEAAYIQHVSQSAGVSPDEPIDLASPEGVAVVEAMIEMENGQQPYSAALIREGRQMAGIG